MDFDEIFAIWPNAVMIFSFVLLMFLIGTKIYQAVNYYPTEKLSVGLTSKRKMDNDDFIDYYIINFGTEKIENHLKAITEWKQEKLSSYKGKLYKIDKFNKRCQKNQYKAFNFVGYRIQTRYQQRNYQRYPYKVKVITNNIKIDDDFIAKRIDFLKEHGFNVTYNQFTKFDQRKALTKELREKIKIRDNFTCQMCGKYMPDEVGLHIDHIVPISKGGKSIPTNLRVLCSKCNGSKGAK